MNANKKSLLRLLAFVMLFSCTPEQRQVVSEKKLGLHKSLGVPKDKKSHIMFGEQRKACW